ncbi:MAG: serine hydrolase [Pseudomonadota bacterium]
MGAFRRFAKVFSVFLIAVVAIAAGYLHRISLVGAGYIAQDLCIEVFHNNRSPQNALVANFGSLHPLATSFGFNINSDKKTVSAALGPFGRTSAVFYDGYGCVIKRGDLADLPPLGPFADVPLAKGDPAALGFDAVALNARLDAIFTDPLPFHRAILIMRSGQIVAERYAPGYDADTALMSASMAKSVTSTMVGAAVHKGLIDLEARAPIPEWSDPKDPRSAITWTHLLQMQSGLEFNEGYLSPFDDVPVMNVLKRSAADFAIQKPLRHEPGTEFFYSTGTSNILQRALRNALEAQGLDYHQFGHEQVFAPLGMTSFIIVPDSVGDFIGGSTAYATARDWARLGQLYLQNGQWKGEQLLSPNWAKYVTTPAEHSDRIYGAQFWLNQTGENGRAPMLPSIPNDAYFFLGFLGQVVLIVPSLDLVFVHLGRTYTDDRELEPINALLEQVMPTIDTTARPQLSPLR